MDSIDLQNLSPDVLKYINALKSENSNLQKENADLKDKVQNQDIRISNLTEMLVNAQKKIFCKSSEQAQYMLTGIPNWFRVLFEMPVFYCFL